MKVQLPQTDCAALVEAIRFHSRNSIIAQPPYQSFQVVLVPLDRSFCCCVSFAAIQNPTVLEHALSERCIEGNAAAKQKIG